MVDGEPIGLDPGQVEDVVDQEEERLGARLGDLDVAPLVVVEPGAREQVGHAHDGVEGAAELVAHRGEEAVLGPVGGVGLLAERLQGAPLRGQDPARVGSERGDRHRDHHVGAERLARHHAVGHAPGGENGREHALGPPGPRQEESARDGRAHDDQRGREEIPGERVLPDPRDHGDHGEEPREPGGPGHRGSPDQHEERDRRGHEVRALEDEEPAEVGAIPDGVVGHRDQAQEPEAHRAVLDRPHQERLGVEGRGQDVADRRGGRRELGHAAPPQPLPVPLRSRRVAARNARLPRRYLRHRRRGSSAIRWAHSTPRRCIHAGARRRRPE